MGLCHPRILPSQATMFCKVTQPHPLSIMFPSQVSFESGFFFPLGVPVFKRKKRNQNVLSIHECDRHLGLAPLMSYLCDCHKSPKGRKTRPVFHTEGYLNVVRGTLKDLKHFITWKDFYWWNLMHFVGVEEIFLSRRKARLAHALKDGTFQCNCGRLVIPFTRVHIDPQEQGFLCPDSCYIFRSQYPFCT